MARRIVLNDAQICALLDKLGIDNRSHVQRIIIDIDTERVVHVYTRAILMDDNLDIFDTLIQGKVIEEQKGQHNDQSI